MRGLRWLWLLGLAWAQPAAALEWASPLGMSLRLPGGEERWQVVPEAELRGPAVFGVRSRSDGTTLILAEAPNAQGVLASELEASARRRLPADLTQGEVLRTTHQTLAAVEIRGVVERPGERWQTTLRMVPTRKAVYTINVGQPVGAPPSAAAVLLDAVRLEGTPASPAPPEPTRRERAVSNLLGDVVMGLLVVGVVAEGIRRRRRSRQQAASETQ